MNVLFASHLFPNPAQPLYGVFVAELAAALAERTQVTVVAPVAWRPGFGREKLPHEREDRGVRIYHPRRIPVPSPFHRYRWRTYVGALNQLPRKTGWDVIHSHWIDPDAMAVANWHGRLGARLVATIHGHAALGLGLKGRKSRNVQRALARMDHVIAVSSELRDLLVHDFEVSPERISVRFNGIDPKKFSFQDQSQARGRLNLPSQAKILIHVARLSIEKRHTILLQALEQGGQEDFHVYFLGEGPLRAEIEAEVNQRNLQNRVFLKGGIPHGDLPAWFAAADLFCLSSAHEGCPVVIQEALACGTPVVSTRVGAVPDLLASCDGIVCDGESPQALAAALQEAFARRWDRPEIAERGGRRSWTAVADDLLDIYRDLPPR